jgi:uncharacterized protein YaaR (DUF327 family)
MRVESLFPDFSLPPDIKSKAANYTGDFGGRLLEMEQIQLQNTLDEQLMAIKEQGQRLCRHMALGDLKKFRQMVAEFLRSCLAGGLKLSQDKMYSRGGKSKLLYIIKTVDEKLMALAQELFSENRDSIKIMSLVDDIRGLLLDLYI